MLTPDVGVLARTLQRPIVCKSSRGRPLQQKVFVDPVSGFPRDDGELPQRVWYTSLDSEKKPRLSQVALTASDNVLTYREPDPSGVPVPEIVPVAACLSHRSYSTH
jgi:hypothetical protein